MLGGGNGASWRTVGNSDNYTITVESLNGEIIDNLRLEVYFPNKWTGYSISSTSGTVSGDVASYQDLVVTNINATSVTLSRAGEGDASGSVSFSTIIVNDGISPEPIDVTCEEWEIEDWGDDGELYLYNKDTTLAFYFDLYYGEDAEDLILGKEYTVADVYVSEATGEQYAGVYHDGEWYYGIKTLSLTKTIDEKGLVHFVGSLVDSLDAAYTFHYDEEEPTGVKDIEGNNAQIFGGNQRIVINNAANATVAIYDVMGRTVVKEQRINTNNAVFAMPQRGMYIVRMGKAAKKVWVR